MPDLPPPNKNDLAATRRPLASCYVDNKSTVFMIDRSYFIQMYVAKDEVEVVNTSKISRKPYVGQALMFNGEKVTTSTKDLAVVGFALANGTYRTRLYFANSEGILVGLEKDSKPGQLGEGEWTESSIAKSKIRVAQHSSISCIMSSDGKAIKIYYWMPDEKGTVPYVAWWTDGQGWQTTTEPVIM